MGGTFLQAFSEDSFFILRDDVVNFEVIQVDQTVHYISPNGVQLGVTRVPLSEHYYPVVHKLAVSSNKDVFDLLPSPDSVQIIRLNFYKSLDPLIPGVVEPVVTVSSQ